MGLCRYMLLAVCACLLALGAASCDTTGKQEATGQQSAVADSAGDDGGAAASAADAADDSAAADEAAGGDTDGAAAADDTGDPGGDDEEIKYYREVNVDFRFLKVDFNPDPDATLSLLRFLFEAWVARGTKVEQEVELTALDELVTAELDLHHSKLELIPIAAKPRLTGEGSLGEYSFRYDGMYRVHLYLPDGTLCGVFAVNSDGELMPAPPEERPAGFGATSRQTRHQYGPRKYQIYRSVEKGQPSEVLYTLQYRGAGFQTLEVVSPDDDIYEYRFPEGRLIVLEGAEKENERPKPRNPEDDYED